MKNKFAVVNALCDLGIILKDKVGKCQNFSDVLDELEFKWSLLGKETN